MEFIKKLIYSKYFLIILSFVLLLVFSTLMFVTIQKDNEPPDGMTRNTAKVVSMPDGSGTETVMVDDDYVEVYRNPIGVEVKLSEKETIVIELYGRIKVSQVPDLGVGTEINVKYSDDDHTKIMYAENVEKHPHILLYIIYSLVILSSIAGIILFARRNRIRDHRIVMEKNMEQMRKEKELAESGAFNSLDRTLSADDIYSPFSDSGIDYNAMYENDRNLGDAAMNENDAYSSFGSGSPDVYNPPAGNDPAAPSAPADENQFSGYGAPNPSMDAPYDPTAPYTGYGGPNPSMDQEYDPFSPYTGY